MGGYFFIKLRFFSAVISGISLILIYNIGTIAFYEFLDIQNIYWIAANAFFIAANIICIIGLYSIERLERVDFFQKQLLHDKQIEIVLINEGLEEQVRIRTQELDKRNEKLQEEIQAREVIEQKLIISKDKAEESDRLKTAFLANMSHEIRTPMNGILGFTELLKEPELTGQEKDKYIEIIQKSGDRMLNTVNDIIEVSKIETGLLKAVYGNTSINKVLEELHEFFELEVNNKGMKLEFHADLKDEDSFVKTDNSMLVSIITNLVKNAIKYSENGIIKFGYQQKSDSLLFFVKDEGIGISKEKQDSIFNRFTQEKQDKSKVVEGSGLGLSISKAYIELLGGKIWVESELGKGSCFCFSHPHDKARNDKEPINKKSAHPTLNFKGKSLLITEDEDYVFAFLNQVLLKSEIEITWAQNGQEAIDACVDKKHFDAILMDINMPVMDGYEATKTIKKQFPNIPIIAQTAFAIKGDKEKIIAAGCDDYLSKPIDIDLLMRTLTKHI
nr:MULTISPECIES: response regulator [unclassified Lentimicrobium]